ncbi:MAG: helix-turn-helix domain-containing protein [Brucella intermedia]
MTYEQARALAPLIKGRLLRSLDDLEREAFDVLQANGAADAIAAYPDSPTSTDEGIELYPADLESTMLLDVAVRMAEERTRLGKSKAEFSRNLCLTQEGWRNIERGRSNFKIGVMVRAADAGVDVQYVVAGVRSLNPPPYAGNAS